MAKKKSGRHQCYQKVKGRYYTAKQAAKVRRKHKGKKK